jgi:hypothetical protein
MQVVEDRNPIRTADAGFVVQRDWARSFNAVAAIAGWRSLQS